MSTYSWNQPCCEACWFSSIGVNSDGTIRVPVRVNEAGSIAQICAFCGNPTIVGIYVRRDPSDLSVRFPALDEDNEEDE